MRLVKFYTYETAVQLILRRRREELTRLGLIIPSSNTTMEPEFCKMLPEGFSVHTTRLKLVDVTIKELALMEKKIEDEALKLMDAEVNVIGYGCTSGSLFKGLGHDKIIQERIEGATRIPAVATAGAVVDALKALDVKRVCVVTPYTDQINNLEEKFLSSSMFQVLELKGLGIKENLKIGKVSSEAVYKSVVKLKYAKADGIFISCTNLATAGIIAKSEEFTQKSVLSSNTATLWAMLRKCGVSTKIQGFGSLLEKV